MIARGSQDETEARHHISLWQGMIPNWNILADEYREAARGKGTVSAGLLREADRTRRDIQDALELGDRLVDNLAPGHEMRRDLFRTAATLEALNESIAISAEQLVPRIEAGRDIAGLKFLLSALKRDAGLGT